MNTCGHIRHILISDYIDDEIDQDTKKRIEDHLAGCADCRRLVMTVKEKMSIISSEAAKEKAPSHLWRSITEKITHEKKSGNAAVDFIRNLTERFMPPRLAPALVGVALLVLSASLPAGRQAFFLYTQHLRSGYGNGNLDYISEVFTSVGSSVVTEHDGLGTPIEEYFL